MMKKDQSRQESIRAFEAALRSSAPLPSFGQGEHIRDARRSPSTLSERYSKDLIYRVVERIKEL